MWLWTNLNLETSPRAFKNVNYRPQRSYGKVMFLHLSVILSTGGHLPQSGFPLGLENLEKWEGIFQSGKSQGILNRLEKSGKSQGKSHKILEN